MAPAARGYGSLTLVDNVAGPEDVLGPDSAPLWTVTLEATRHNTEVTEVMHVRAVSLHGALALAEEQRFNLTGLTAERIEDL